MDSKTFAMEIHRKESDELNSMRIDIFDYLLDLGADPNKVRTLCAIDAELSIRDFNQKVKEGLGLA